MVLTNNKRTVFSYCFVLFVTLHYRSSRLTLLVLLDSIHTPKLVKKLVGFSYNVGSAVFTPECSNLANFRSKLAVVTATFGLRIL
jgi:hypothetical protein